MVVPIHMGWRHVLFANWPVEPAVVAPHLPESLVLDTFDDRAWLSVVPFTNVDVRPAWWPRGSGIPLPELNLRTYVVHDGTPGVYFFSLDARGIAAVIGARTFHHLPYYYARIDIEPRGGEAAGIGATGPADAVEFASRRLHPGARPAHLQCRYGPVGEAFVAAPGSLEHFLVKRDRYYTQAPDGSVRHADVSHEPWPLYPAAVEFEENTLFRANGFAEPATDSLHLYSPFVDVVASESRSV